MPQSARDLRIQRLKSLTDQRVPFEKTGYRMLLEEATCEESFAKHRKADAFLFAPESEIWRINRERCGLIYGPAAAVLQVSHPRVAQGVHDHSKFRTDTIGRLHRTIESTNRIVFGTISEAEAMRTRLAAVHRKVRGAVSAGVSGPPAYSAFEPDLLLWVLATLITAAVRGYEFIYGELPSRSKRGVLSRYVPIWDVFWCQ